MGRKDIGLYGKFRVERMDGQHKMDGKHCGCEYFVLDLTCDPHALPALKAYRKSCARSYPLLAGDLKKIITRLEFKHLF